jgi:hypothetical protein
MVCTRHLTLSSVATILLMFVPEAVAQITPSASSLPSTPREQQLVGHQIKTGIVPSVFTERQAPIIMSSEVTIATENVKIKRGDSLSSLLQWRGINPDSDAISIVFDLNPELKNSKSFVPDQAIVLPSVTTTNPGVEAALDKGQLVALVSDQELKSDLKTNTTSFEQLADRISKEDLRRSDFSEGQIEAILESMKATKQSLKELKNANYPASKKVFQQLNADLKTALSWNLAVVTASDRERIVFIMATVADNVSDTAAALREGSSGKVPVEVITMLQNGDIVPNLQVLSTPILRENDPGDPFRKNSSPAKDDRPPARYLIWATREGVVVSAKKAVRIRIGDTQPVDLEIIQ